MTDYEWEVGRMPRPRDERGPGGHHHRKGPVAEYAALEFPRESVTWVVNSKHERERERPEKGRSTSAESVNQGSAPT
jgi:hypothetical protein